MLSDDDDDDAPPARAFVGTTHSKVSAVHLARFVRAEKTDNPYRAGALMRRMMTDWYDDAPYLYGIPEPLAVLASALTGEGGMGEDYHVAFFEAIQEGADLAPAMPRWLIWLLGKPYPCVTNQGRAHMARVAGMLDRTLAGDDPSDETWLETNSALAQVYNDSDHMGVQLAHYAACYGLTHRSHLRDWYDTVAPCLALRLASIYAAAPAFPSQRLPPRKEVQARLYREAGEELLTLVRACR